VQAAQPTKVIDGDSEGADGPRAGCAVPRACQAAGESRTATAPHGNVDTAGAMAGNGGLASSGCGGRLERVAEILSRALTRFLGGFQLRLHCLEVVIASVEVVFGDADFLAVLLQAGTQLLLVFAAWSRACWAWSRDLPAGELPRVSWRL
jgi:hypothetical protein